jgi:hypothetical protein
MPARITRAAGSLAGALFALVLLAGSAVADGPAVGQILVPGDHHLPGETIQLTGYDLDPGAKLAFQLIVPSRTTDLASAVVAADGTVAASAVVPATFPRGYAQVVGTATGGDQWTTTVLIGERAEGPGSQPGAAGMDPLPLTLLGGGLILFAAAAAWHLRGRRGPAAPGA